jgi:hypothetical protein
MHKAEIVRSNPPDAPGLIDRKSEVDPIGVLHDRGALHPAEPTERIPKESDGPGSGFLIGNHQVSLKVAAPGAKGAEAPVQPPLAIHINGAGTDVLQETAEPAPLERADAAEEQIVSQ